MTTGERIGRDRMGRAEDYVLGLMDEAERMRAERDMAVDPEFRDCVLELAQKLQRLHDMKRPEKSADEAWNEIAARIAELPQMSRERLRARPGRPAAPARALPSRIVARRPVGRGPVGRGLDETGGRRGLVVAFGIVAVFAIGYLVGYLR